MYRLKIDTLAYVLLWIAISLTGLYAQNENGSYYPLNISIMHETPRAQDLSGPEFDLLFGQIPQQFAFQTFGADGKEFYFSKGDFTVDLQRETDLAIVCNIPKKDGSRVIDKITFHFLGRGDFVFNQRAVVIEIQNSKWPDIELGVSLKKEKSTINVYLDNEGKKTLLKDVRIINFRVYSDNSGSQITIPIEDPGYFEFALSPALVYEPMIQNEKYELLESSRQISVSDIRDGKVDLLVQRAWKQFKVKFVLGFPGSKPPMGKLAIDTGKSADGIILNYDKLYDRSEKWWKSNRFKLVKGDAKRWKITVGSKFGPIPENSNEVYVHRITIEPRLVENSHEVSLELTGYALADDLLVELQMVSTIGSSDRRSIKFKKGEYSKLRTIAFTVKNPPQTQSNQLGTLTVHVSQNNQLGKYTKKYQIPRVGSGTRIVLPVVKPPLGPFNVVLIDLTDKAINYQDRQVLFSGVESLEDGAVLAISNGKKFYFGSDLTLEKIKDMKPWTFNFYNDLRQLISEYKSSEYFTAFAKKRVVKFHCILSGNTVKLLEGDQNLEKKIRDEFESQGLMSVLNSGEQPSEYCITFYAPSESLASNLNSQTDIPLIRYGKELKIR